MSENRLSEIRERWANNYCPDCCGDCYATTAYEDVQFLLGLFDRVATDLTRIAESWKREMGAAEA